MKSFSSLAITVLAFALLPTLGWLTGGCASSSGDSSAPKPGSGIAIFACADVSGTDVKVRDNSSYGLLIDDAGAQLGDETGGLEVENNAPGVWVQNVGQSGTRTVSGPPRTASRSAGRR